LRAQGIDRKQLVYHSTLQPYLSYWGLFFCTIFILVNNFEVFWNFNAAGFLTGYINIPIFFGLWMGWKLVKRTKVWKPKERDFVTVGSSFSDRVILADPRNRAFRRWRRLKSQLFHQQHSWRRLPTRFSRPKDTFCNFVLLLS
jgi:amino acid permease